MTKLQRRSLQILLEHRAQTPTIISLLWTNRVRYALLLLWFGLLGGLWYYLAGGLVASYLAVAVAAVILRDIGYFRMAVAVWPVNRAIIDWQKAEHLATANNISTPTVNETTTPPS